MDDFYNYVNKDWLMNNPIPNDKSKISQFDILTEKNLDKIKKLITNHIDESNNIKILYNQSLSDYNYLNEINKYFDEINNIKSIDELIKKFIDYHIIFNLNSLLILYVHSDLNNSSLNILHIGSGGLGLPDKEYYFRDNKEKTRDDYKIFMKSYVSLFNLNLNMEKIYFIEKLLAEKTYSSPEERDINLINNIRTYDEIKNDYPKVYLFIKYFLNKINKPKGLFNVINPKFLKRVDELLINDLLELWKDFLKYKLMLAVYNIINNDIETLYLNFYNKKLQGTKELVPKWERSIELINNLLGQELGKLYIQKYYNRKINNNILLIINYIKQAINNEIKDNQWLEEVTKKKALLKLHSMNIKIGYPKNNGLYNYDELKLSENNTFFGNILLCITYDNYLKYAELYNPVNKDRWHMHPQIVNAYYSPSSNEIVFPAAILQEPFFYENDIIKSFGGIGVIIGHEIVHGFDNKGRLFDENGNLNNWWQPNDNERYCNLVNKLIDQYNSYKIHDEFINGKLTLGENIADLGGVNFALKGLELYKNLSNEDYKIFFKNYAFIWAINIRKEKELHNLLSDPHAPNIFRVNGILKNINKFYEIYKIKDGDMYLNPEDRIKIW
uniref:Peptidase M13 C-terminal domain-containing protein n=1 Tax=viral metagenome TaxID=1070528 RepID=A0A6C0DC81_9ZZZZ